MSTGARLDLTRTDIGKIYPPMGNIHYHCDNAYWDHNGEFVRWDETGKNAFPAKINPAAAGQAVELKRELAAKAAALELRERENAALKAKLAELSRKAPEQPASPAPGMTQEEKAERDALTAEGGKKAEDITDEELDAARNDPNAGNSPLIPGKDVLARVKAWAADDDDATITQHGFTDWQEFQDAVQNAYGERPASKAEARKIILGE